MLPMARRTRSSPGGDPDREGASSPAPRRPRCRWSRPRCRADRGLCGAIEGDDRQACWMSGRRCLSDGNEVPRMTPRCRRPRAPRRSRSPRCGSRSLLHRARVPGRWPPPRRFGEHAPERVATTGRSARRPDASGAQLPAARLGWYPRSRRRTRRWRVSGSIRFGPPVEQIRHRSLGETPAAVATGKSSHCP